MKRASSLFPSRFPVMIVLSLSLLIGLAPITTRSQTQMGGDDYTISDLEKAVLQEMNQARTDPRAYASYLAAMRTYYKGKNYMPPNGRQTTTIEGVSGLDEAIKFLQAANPLPPLQLSKGMCMGAKDQSFDQSQTGAISHQGSDKSFSWDRVARYGDWKTPISENIAYDGGTARDIVINLIIDDGVPSRGHRNNIFNGSYIVTGVSCGKHPLFGGMCVCTFAGGFTEKASQNRGATTTTGQPASSGQTAAPRARKL